MSLKYQVEEKSKRKNMLLYNVFSISNFWLLNFFGIVVSSIILLNGFSDNIFPKLNTGEITTLLLYSGSIFFTLMEVFEQIVLLKTLDVKIDRLVEVLHFDVSEKTLYQDDSNPVIELKNLGHKFENNWLFKDVNMRIPFNSKIAITGQTGCGKSTLGLLIAGVYKATLGDVKINGVATYNADFSSSNVMSIVYQDVAIFNATVRENITLGKQGAEEKLNDILSITCCDEFITQLTEGLETKLTEGGKTLSGGQIQRIGLARALLMNPKILILDEISSALDEDTEKQINDKLFSMKDITLISITHRRNTIGSADFCYKLSSEGLELVN